MILKMRIVGSKSLDGQLNILWSRFHVVSPRRGHIIHA